MCWGSPTDRLAGRAASDVLGLQPSSPLTVCHSTSAFRICVVCQPSTLFLGFVTPCLLLSPVEKRVQAELHEQSEFRLPSIRARPGCIHDAGKGAHGSALYVRLGCVFTRYKQPNQSHYT